MEVRDKLHASATLPQGKTPEPIKYVAVWAAGFFETFLRI
jgi:hypothetical protein